MSHDRSKLLPDTLELLQLKTLWLEPIHGWGNAQGSSEMLAENRPLGWRGGGRP